MRREAYVAMPDTDYMTMLCMDVIGLKALGWPGSLPER